MKKKAIALVLACVMCVGIGIGGTLAWLKDDTTTLTNTFTAGDINIELAEGDNLDLKMVPNKTITKDPKVTLKANSEPCWLFVEITKSSTYSDYLADYEVADGWTAVSGVSGVYYKKIDSIPTTDQVFPVLKDNQVKVKADVTKAQLNAVTNGTVDAPTLTFTAYAIQSADLTNADGAVTTAEAAWALAKPLSA